MSLTWHQQIKDINRESFISAGKKVFVNKKFNNVSLKEICDLASLSKVTFYKSFSSLDELVFAIQERIFFDFDNYLHEKIKITNTGIDDLRAYLNSLMDYSILASQDIQFIGFFDYVYRDDIIDISLRSHYKKILDNSFFISFLKDSLNKGIEDQTIYLQCSMSTAIAFIIEIFMSMIQRISIKGHYLTREHHVSLDEIRTMTIHSVLLYLTNHAYERKPNKN